MEESQFDGKGFKMIEQIDKYFNPSGTVDSLSYIFNLISVKQALDESVITLKAQFSRLFASVKLGGVAIDSALQVGFMLRALLLQYHGVVQDFCLGCHSLVSTTLQSVMEQCMAVVSHLVMYRTKVLMYRTMVLLARLTKVRR